MKKALLALLALVLVAVLGATAYGVYFVRRLNTPEFQRQLLDQAKAAVGADVRVKQMDISLLSGVTLKGISIANPPPFPGDLLTADGFVLHYRLRPLLARRLEVDRVSLDRPVLRLLMDARGIFNYERLGARGARTPASAGVAVPLHVVLQRLEVGDGSVTLTDNTKARLLTIEDIGFRSSFEIEGGVAKGTGNATIANMSLGDLLFLRSVRSPLTLSKETVTLSPIRADVAGAAPPDTGPCTRRGASATPPTSTSRT